MATQGERRALVFLAAVALLGAGTRAYRARHVAVDTTALVKQLEAVDSLAARPRRRSTTKRNSRSVEPAPAAPASLYPTDSRIDLDTAPAEEIEKLPGIGPALAKRIIQDREAKGPFGCLAALDRVKGIGPAVLSRIDSLATFSAVGGAPCARPGRLPEGLLRL